MDLGYGNKNQAVGSAAAAAIIRSVQAQEDAIHAEIDRYDSLLESTDAELEILREKRIQQMKRMQEKKNHWKAQGHGVYSSLGQGQHGADVAKEFFDATKESERMVVHFHRSSTRVCDIFHAHLEKLAVSHLETRFVKINVDSIAEDGASGSGVAYLVEKLGIVVMPTLVLVKDRQVTHQIRGFDELGGSEHFSLDTLEWILGAHGAINKIEGGGMPEELQRTRKGVNGVTLTRRYAGGVRGGVRTDDTEYDDEE
jgi:hypothetical protein